MSEEEDNVIRLAQLRSNPLFGERRKVDDAPPIINSTKDSNDWLSKTHATIILNGKFKILREKDDDTIEFMDVKDFIIQNKDRKLSITGEDGKTKSVPFTEVWLGSTSRRRYDNGVTFNPGRLGDYNGMYNLFRGYKIEPKKGDITPWMNFINEVMCRNDSNNFNFLDALICDMFQRPHLKPGVAVVIRGEEGVGKSFFVEKLSALMNPYYFKTSNPEYIFGDHNGQLKHVILLHLEEAVWPGGKKTESLMKDIIAGPTIPINDKFIPVYMVPNHLHLFITGNPDWLVMAGFKARRPFALHASDAHIRDTDYFKKLDEWFNTGGKEALMYHYLNQNSDINLRIVPVTEELVEQKHQSLSGVNSWAYSIADMGEMPYGDLLPNGHVRVIKKIILNEYNHSPSAKRNELNDRQFGKQLTTLMPEIVVDNIKIRDSRDVRRDGYDIPDLITFRKLLEAKMGGKCKWSNNDNEWTVLKPNTDFDFSLYRPDR
jgi:uncharacterized protein DUF5906